MKKKIKSIVNALLGPMGLEIGKKIKSPPSFNYFQTLLEGIFSTAGRMDIVQVGANDGSHGDPIHSFLIEHKEFTKALLIEPQPEMITHLKHTYADHPDISIFNGAIGGSDSLLLYRLKPDLWSSFHAPYLKDAPAYRAPSGLTSSNKSHVIKALRQFLDPALTPEDAVESLQVPCRRLYELLQQMNFPKTIHLLQVDAEGADDQVIYACDIETLQPLTINFESKHLSLKQTDELERFLTRNRYRIFHWSKSDTLAVRQPR